MTASSTSMIWLTEIEQALINEIYPRTYLWNVKDKNYTKKSLKKSGYEEVCKILAARWPEKSFMFSPESLIRKFNNLKSYYRRECKKWTQLKRNLAYVNFVPRWEHFARLRFLDDCLIAEDISSDNQSFTVSQLILKAEEDISSDLEQSSTVSQPIQTAEKNINSDINPSFTLLRVIPKTEDDSQEFELNAIQDEESDEPFCQISEMPSSSTPAKKRKKETLVTDASQKATEILQNNRTEENDADYYFGMYIASTLRKMPKEKSGKIKFQIHKVLYDALNE